MEQQLKIHIDSTQLQLDDLERVNSELKVQNKVRPGPNNTGDRTCRRRPKNLKTGSRPWKPACESAARPRRPKPSVSILVPSSPMLSTLYFCLSHPHPMETPRVEPGPDT